MAEIHGNKRVRTSFIESDVRLLVKCVRAHSNVLGSKKESGVTPAMKNKVKICFD